ncbi:hypothetical protein HYPSUDRAFT_65460 [Hypholoma sublateritium FD-334 SS-4]|uniref:Uncharacterized protein n=1 Tax=Hypholoma sublateritium (strain FD-334 SS-4) TaxID=945553 RepID=A0A0D2LBG1_HYPSF|nr:hypothetical protein HYPSUDRAFT_65460 [Hypholoma sublateritium FD-334 SS-4]
MEIPITSYFSLGKPSGERKRDLDAPNLIFSASKKQKHDITNRSKERLSNVTSTRQELEISTVSTAISTRTSRQTCSGTGSAQTQTSSSTAKPRTTKRQKTNPPLKAQHPSGLHKPPNSNTKRSSTSLHIRTTLPQPPQRQLRGHPTNREEDSPNNAETTAFDPYLTSPQDDPNEHNIPSSQTQDMTESCPNDCHRAPSSKIPDRQVQSSSQGGVLPLSDSLDVDSLGRCSYHLINDQHQIIPSSQTQFLDPFNQSPRKERISKNMVDINQEELTENSIPSSQSQEWELSLLVDRNAPSFPQRTAPHRPHTRGSSMQQRTVPIEKKIILSTFSNQECSNCEGSSANKDSLTESETEEEPTDNTNLAFHDSIPSVFSTGPQFSLRPSHTTGALESLGGYVALPLALKEFQEMFNDNDESYPPDFPMSLRS